MTYFAIFIIILIIVHTLKQRQNIRLLDIITANSDHNGDGFHFIPADSNDFSPKDKSLIAAYMQERGIECLDIIPQKMPFTEALKLSMIGKNQVQSFGRALVLSHHAHQAISLKDKEKLPLTRLVKEIKKTPNLTLKRAILPQSTATSRPLQQDFLEFYDHAFLFADILILLYFSFCLLLWILPFFSVFFGIIAITIYHIQPLIIFQDSSIEPPNMRLNILLRLPMDTLRLIRILFIRLRLGDFLHPKLQAKYRQLFKGGTERFFNPKLAVCQICGHTNLKPFLTVKDLLQQKPGIFNLEQCQRCGHIFQNPRLNCVGLNCYYSDFYEGLLGEVSELIFESNIRHYLYRINLVLEKMGNPESWLDVGTGHGHFCKFVKEKLPNTRIDGLDLNDNAKTHAKKYGWMDEYYQGQFTELADSFLESYDVVSMHQYLEHTPNPEKEIKAAYKSLKSGGYLLVESPNPDSAIGRKLGRFWFSWFQPQHLNFLNQKNLTRILKNAGFDEIYCTYNKTHQASDTFGMVFFFMNQISTSQNMPWTKKSLRGFIWRNLIIFLLLPFFALALIIDRILEATLSTPKLSNCYRILGRKKTN